MSMFSGITIALREDNGFELNMADVRMEFSESFQVLNSTAVEFDQWCAALDRLEQLNRSIEQHDGRADKSLITFLNQNNDLAEVLGVDLSLENWDEGTKGAEIRQGYSMAMEGVWEAIKNFFINIWEGIKNFFKNFFNMFKSTKANFEAVKNDPKAAEKIANAPAPAKPAAVAALVAAAKEDGVEVKMLSAPKEQQTEQAPNQDNANKQEQPAAKTEEPKVYAQMAIKCSAFIRVFNGAKACYEGLQKFDDGWKNARGGINDIFVMFVDLMKKPLASVGADCAVVGNEEGRRIHIGKAKKLLFQPDEYVNEGKSYGDILVQAGWGDPAGVEGGIQCANMVQEYTEKLKDLENRINIAIKAAESDTASKAPNSAGPIKDKGYRSFKLEVFKEIGRCILLITEMIGKAGKRLNAQSEELRAIVEKYQKIG